jgi:hypothetical protein
MAHGCSLLRDGTARRGRVWRGRRSIRELHGGRRGFRSGRGGSGELGATGLVDGRSGQGAARLCTAQEETGEGEEGSSARETTKWKLLDMSKCRTSEETDEAEGPMHRARDLASQRRGHRVDLIEGDRRGWLTLSGVRTLLPKAPQK